MLLTIKSKAPSWWMLEEKQEPRTIKEWWDGLEWQDYKVPDEFSCINLSIREELVCYIDKGSHHILESAGSEWLYKMFSNVGMQVRVGIESELTHVKETNITELQTLTTELISIALRYSDFVAATPF